MLRLSVAEGTQYQTPSESVPYTIDAANWLTAVTTATVTVYDTTDPYTKTDVTNSVLTGSVAVSGTQVSLPPISGLTDGKIYTVTVLMRQGAAYLEASFRILCDDGTLG